MQFAVRIWMCGVLVLASSALTRAQAPAEDATPGTATPAGAPASAAFDSVRLKDGSIYRGTILEHSPGGRTVILLHDGTKKEISADLVAEVIPALAAAESVAGAPSSSPPEPAAKVDVAAPAPVQQNSPPDSVRVHVHTTRGYELFARFGGENEFERLCADDCEKRLKPGPYEFKLGRPGSDSSWVGSDTFDVEADSRVEAHLNSRRAVRIVGGILLGAGILTGSIMLGKGISTRNDARDACHDAPAAAGCNSGHAGRGLIIGGPLAAAASAIVAAIMLSRRDQFTVRVNPEGTLGPTRPPEQDPKTKTTPAKPEGELRLRPELSGAAVEQAQAVVHEKADAIRLCIYETPATAEFYISVTGAISRLDLFGDLEPSERSCLRSVLSKLTFPAGEPRAVTVDIQPSLR